MSEIFERLREERKRLKMNQNDFGSLGGVTLDTQSNYEIGKRFPDSNYLSAIAAAGADVLYILTGVRSGGAEAQPLTRDEECLLDNYRNSDESGQAAMRATGAAFAQSKQVRSVGKKAG